MAELSVAMFASSLPQGGRKPGGVDVLFHKLANALVDRGHEVRIWSFSQGPEDARYTTEVLEPSRFAHDRVARMTRVPVRLNRIAFIGADVLHLQGDDWFFLRRRLPTLRGVYGSALYEARHATSVRRAVSQMALFPMEVLAARLATTSWGMVPGDSRLHGNDGSLPGGVTLPARSDGQRAHVPTILFVGTWEGRKRGRLLANIFADYIRPKIPEAELWMVSDRCEPREGLRHFRTPDDATLSSLYGRAWVFCLPSSYEGFGLPYLEAMAHGTPVVATPNLGSRYVLRDGADGMMVGDEDLPTALIALLEDPEWRARLADAGRRRSASFSWDAVAKQHEDAYRLTIERWRGR